MCVTADMLIPQCRNSLVTQFTYYRYNGYSVCYQNHGHSFRTKLHHYSDVTMSKMASEITGVSIVGSIVCSGADQRKH